MSYFHFKPCLQKKISLIFALIRPQAVRFFIANFREQETWYYSQLQTKDLQFYANQQGTNALFWHNVLEVRLPTDRLHLNSN